MPNLGILPLNLLPLLRAQQPRDRVSFGHHRRRAGRAREEGKFATGGAGDDALVELSLREMILGSKDAIFEQIEPRRFFALAEYRCSDHVLSSVEKGTSPEPKILILVREIPEGLQDQGQRLFEVLPLGRRERFVLAERLMSCLL